ncbi:hypothetical protein V5F79_22375 [Xanthobacter flavus]|uniref:hypothetical protein n=1 Tax=Xanthobacter flavus TaxID=281 RepID=UPI00372954B8
MGPLSILATCIAVGCAALVAGFFAGQRFRTGTETFLARRLTEANRCIRELQAAIKSGVGKASLLSMIRRYWEAQSSDASPETYADPAGDVPAVPVHAIGDRNV